jgi:hypothetical protein
MMLSIAGKRAPNRADLSSRTPSDCSLSLPGSNIENCEYQGKLI